MQYLGEICTAWRSRVKSKQDEQQVKARKEIQKRSFWRRFFSSFLSLLKEKRPPEAKRTPGHWPGVARFGRSADQTPSASASIIEATIACAMSSGSTE